MGIAAPQSRPAPSGVQSFVAPLSQMPIEALLQEFNNPASQFPKFAVLTAMQKKQEQARMQQAMQGQMAMAQNAQQQQQPPIAQGILAGAQQLAAQDQMPTYNTGGVVALQVGGVPGIQNPDFDEEGLPRTNAERERIIKNNAAIRERFAEATPEQIKQAEAVRMRQAYLKSMPTTAQRSAIGQALQRYEDFYKPRDPEAYTPEKLGFVVAGVPEALKDTRQVPMPTPTSTANVATAGTSAGTSADRKPAGTAPTGGILTLDRKTTDAEKATEDYIANAQSALRTQKDYPEEVLVGRRGIEALVQDQLKAQKEERERMAKEAREQYEGVKARQTRSVLDDPQALLATAGGISTKKGEVFGSLSRGLASVMAQRDAAIEAARKEYSAAQQAERQMAQTERQMILLEAQRVQALREKDFDRANAIDAQIRDLNGQLAKFKVDRADAARNFQLESRKVAATERAAAKPSAGEALIDFFNRDPEGFKRYIEAQNQPKVEGNILRDLVKSVMTNPMMMQTLPPEIQDMVKKAMQRELENLSATSAPPKGAGVRE